MEELGGTIPAATALHDVAVGDGEFASLIRAETKDSRAVRRTVGSFEVRQRAEKKARNPQTGEEVSREHTKTIAPSQETCYTL